MSRVLASSDFHLSPATANYVWAALEELRSHVQPGDSTVWVGDILDQGQTIHAALFTRLRAIARTWPGPLYILVGNHDRFGPGWLDTVLPAIDGESCKVVAHPKRTDLGRMIPYCLPEQFSAVWASQTAGLASFDGPKRVIWAHHGFKGAYRNSLSVDRDGISVRSLELGDEIIVSGHYHLPQVMGRVVYCGSPYEVSFAEEGQQKGWLLWEDFPKGTPLRVPFENVGAPRHLTVKWDPEEGIVTPSWLTSKDRVRVAATVTKDVGVRAISQLKAAGLEGAAVAYAPGTGMTERAIVSSLDPRRAAEEYVGTLASQGESLAWAEGRLWG